MIDLGEHCQQAAAIVATWPAWKRNVLGFWSSNQGAVRMTPEQFIKRSFAIVESVTCPPSENARRATWLRHRDGREALLLHGTQYPSRFDGDWMASDAFGGDACHCCAKAWSFGQMIEGEYRPHYTTTDREPKLCGAGKPCSACRERIAKEIMDKAVKEVESTTGRRVVWIAEEDAKPASKVASMADVTIVH